MNECDVETCLCARFKELYPNIVIGRPYRFLETVERIAAPVRHGKSPLTGIELQLYRQRLWKSRIRNPPKGVVVV